MIAPFRRTRVEDNDLRQVQDAVGFVFQDILSKQIVDGIFIKDVILNGIKLVNHGLGRKPIGYLVVSKDANENVWDHQAENKTPLLNLSLESSGPVKVSLWVF